MAFADLLKRGGAFVDNNSVLVNNPLRACATDCARVRSVKGGSGIFSDGNSKVTRKRLGTRLVCSIYCGNKTSRDPWMTYVIIVG